MKVARRWHRPGPLSSVQPGFYERRQSQFNSSRRCWRRTQIPHPVRTGRGDFRRSAVDRHPAHIRRLHADRSDQRCRDRALRQQSDDRAHSARPYPGRGLAVVDRAPQTGGWRAASYPDRDPVFDDRGRSRHSDRDRRLDHAGAQPQSRLHAGRAGLRLQHRRGGAPVSRVAMPIAFAGDPTSRLRRVARLADLQHQQADLRGILQFAGALSEFFRRRASEA